ncbi:MAG: Type 1 glutamine amidotransferase-like domain-containing protein [Myxococcales bacterium]|nr:Type 1 glutamine amidotransferase-like domain-containing protein [Myxococcales bacterium]
MYTETPKPATGVLLGPQRLAVTVDRELEALTVEGRVAAITCGWQERESEDTELQAALGNRVINLRLHARSDDVFADDPELRAAHRAKQDRLRQLQALYRGRLAHAVEAVHELHAARAPADMIAAEIDAAIEAIRLVDRQHVARVTLLNREYEDALCPSERPVVAAHREEIADVLDHCGAVAIAGGNVATILNRLRLFGLDALLRGRTILAWSAGAMALTERVILFHDSPPQGRGNAEILDAGLGLFPEVVALPHARRRLLLDDRRRVSLFARRFAPARCVVLDERCRLAFQDGRYRAGPITRALGCDGELAAIEPWRP